MNRSEPWLCSRQGIVLKQLNLLNFAAQNYHQKDKELLLGYARLFNGSPSCLKPALSSVLPATLALATFVAVMGTAAACTAIVRLQNTCSTNTHTVEQMNAALPLIQSLLVVNVVEFVFVYPCTLAYYLLIDWPLPSVLCVYLAIIVDIPQLLAIVCHFLLALERYFRVLRPGVSAVYFNGAVTWALPIVSTLIIGYFTHRDIMKMNYMSVNGLFDLPPPPELHFCLPKFNELAIQTAGVPFIFLFMLPLMVAIWLYNTTNIELQRICHVATVERQHSSASDYTAETAEHKASLRLNRLLLRLVMCRFIALAPTKFIEIIEKKVSEPSVTSTIVDLDRAHIGCCLFAEFVQFLAILYMLWSKALKQTVFFYSQEEQQPDSGNGPLRISVTHASHRHAEKPSLILAQAQLISQETVL